MARRADGYPWGTPSLRRFSGRRRGPAGYRLTPLVGCGTGKGAGTASAHAWDQERNPEETPPHESHDRAGPGGDAGLEQLTRCGCALAAVLSPRCPNSTAGVGLPITSSTLVPTTLDSPYFQADSCRDGREKHDRVIRCSADQTDAIPRLQGVLSHGDFEFEVAFVTAALHHGLPEGWARLGTLLALSRLGDAGAC